MGEHGPYEDESEGPPHLGPVTEQDELSRTTQSSRWIRPAT
jgi:hypothetical protein